MTTFDVDQAGWGSTLEYADGELDGEWDPQYIIIHWGGLTSERDTDELAFESLQGWQRYHLGKGWQDIAYNYAVTEEGTIVRLRGENHGGHTSGTDPETGKLWSTVGVGVVWVGGQSDEDGPSQQALAAMQRLVDERGLPVMTHQQTGKATACAGPDWLGWVEDYEPEETNMNDQVSNPAFQPAWDKAIEVGMFSKYTLPSDEVTAEKLAVFLDRIGLLEEKK